MIKHQQKHLQSQTEAIGEAIFKQRLIPNYMVFHGNFL